MVEMVLNSARLFFAGKLFRDGRAVFVQWAKGFAVSLALVLLFGWLVSPVIGVVVASLVGGALQPLLFKDLKYA